MNRNGSSASGGKKKLPHVHNYKAQRILFGNPFEWEQYNKLGKMDKTERRAKLQFK